MERLQCVTGHIPGYCRICGNTGWYITVKEDDTLEDMIRTFCALAVERAGGNKAEAARRIGVTRPTLYRLLGHKPAPKPEPEPEDPYTDWPVHMERPGETTDEYFARQRAAGLK